MTSKLIYTMGLVDIHSKILCLRHTFKDVVKLFLPAKPFFVSFLEILFRFCWGLLFGNPFSFFCWAVMWHLMNIAQRCSNICVNGKTRPKNITIGWADSQTERTLQLWARWCAFCESIVGQVCSLYFSMKDPRLTLALVLMRKKKN